MAFELLNEEDKGLINNYIAFYAEGESVNLKWGAEKASLNTILNTWNENKQEYLQNLLGNELIIRKPIQFKRSVEVLARDIARELNYHNFSLAFKNLLTTEACFINDRYVLMYLVDSYVLANNSWDDNEAITIAMPNEKSFKLTKGMKPMKALSRIAQHYNLPDFEDFRIRHSQLLNQKALHGTMCISIHPLDYMTMSDNNSNWESCMNWRDTGDYRAGTVEMMNSDSVVCVYLEGSEPMSIGDEGQWNNKKWRELFVVTPEVISEVKGYPYQSDELVTIALDWLRDLARKNLGWEYENTQIKHRGSHYMDPTPTTEDGDKINLDFETYAMYNDFGTKEYHLAMVMRDHAMRTRTANGYVRDNNWYINITYSGRCTCVWCGKDMTNEAMDQTNRVICTTCGAGGCRCDSCGDLHDEDDLYEVDGDWLCQYCIDESCSEDSITGELHYTDNMYELYLCASDTNPADSCCDSIMLMDIHNDYTYHWERYFVDGVKSIKKYEHIGYYGYSTFYYYVNPADLTDNGARLWSYSSVSEAIDDIEPLPSDDKEKQENI